MKTEQRNNRILPKSPNGHKTARTTIGIKLSTKSQLNSRRAPGQCYDGFLCQLMNTWDAAHQERRPMKTNPENDDIVG